MMHSSDLTITDAFFLKDKLIIFYDFFFVELFFCLFVCFARKNFCSHFFLRLQEERKKADLHLRRHDFLFLFCDICWRSGGSGGRWRRPGRRPLPASFTSTLLQLVKELLYLFFSNFFFFYPFEKLQNVGLWWFFL